MNEEHNVITITNARIHNLKNVTVTIPKKKLTVITGVSGSGKSSLAFDTLYEEGKRRYLMFSGTQFMVDAVPFFDSITGLSPTAAVEQRVIRQSNPRSTVGTRTKISAMLAALYAGYGVREPEYDDGQPLAMEMFQKNSARGMCVKCLGKGRAYRLNEEAVFDKATRVCDVACGLGSRGKIRHALNDFCTYYGIDMWQDRIGDLTEEQLALLKYGDSRKTKFYGMIPLIHIHTNGSVSSSGRLAYLMTEAGLMEEDVCGKCGGTGLSEQAAHTFFAGKTIADLEQMCISDLTAFLEAYEGKRNPLLDEIKTKLSCMMSVGLKHLSLSRPVPTLSGGEIQRLFLASYMIAEMDSVIFVFDEPTIGLHETEKENLIRIIRKLVEAGNTVVAVEHDENFMREADYLIDMGPDAGKFGGVKIYEGGYEEFLSCTASKTAPYLTGRKGFRIKERYRPINPKNMLTIAHASIHNLRDVTVNIPLGVMVGIAGVSGSGKSSLVSDTLVPKLKELMKTKCVTGDDAEEAEQNENRVGMDKAVVMGSEQIRRCYVIDQRPIGRSRTSSPATYTGIFDRVRTLFAETKEAKERGYTPGLFSVNSEGGCQRCKGDGVIHYHVGFGNLIDIDCKDCGGSGYIPEAMEVKLDGKSIRDVLLMSVDEARDFFVDKDKTITHTLNVLHRVGMGYIGLGQATPTISGGESQRIKLAKELAKGKNAKGCLYILDEPTTGLSFSDSERLIELMEELVDCGNSVIVTEHDPYLLSNCDYILEMGRGGGSEGGSLIAEGTPQELMQNPDSVTGKYLKRA